VQFERLSARLGDSDAQEADYTILHPGEVEPGQVTKTIAEEVKRVQPERTGGVSFRVAMRPTVSPPFQPQDSLARATANVLR